MSLSQKHLHDEAAAIAKLESILWPNGPVCPHCQGAERITKVGGKTARLGLWRCLECKKQFTVTVGTLLERSHVKAHLWFQAVYLLAASKKGFSAHQLHRTLGVTYKTAWFMAHRIREAMRDGTLAPLGGEGKVVEADETYFGDKATITHRTKRGKSGHSSKRSVVALVERGGPVRTFHVDRATKRTVGKIVVENVALEARLHTDESRLYGDAKHHVAKHESVRHAASEYVLGDVHINSAEGFFSIFKRGMKGVYQHCSEKHLHRYLAEFDFRYNERAALGVNDERRAIKALAGIRGKRLTYRDSFPAVAVR